MSTKYVPMIQRDGFLLDKPSERIKPKSDFLVRLESGQAVMREIEKREHQHELERQMTWLRPKVELTARSDKIVAFERRR